ncbi:MAG: hypothetical protein JWO57_3524 [Pseudonocardiales bacterium]|nr:hypothetical protein [Pseudonocardiales bacterium]
MVFVVGITAAMFLGLGWVLQQRVAAASSQSAQLMSWRVLRQLIGSPRWWLGIGAMAAGQTLGAWALQLAAVTLVEPLLVTCLLFAFAISAYLARQPLRWQEIAGSAMLCAALAAFLAVGNPRPDLHSDPGWPSIAMATGLTAAVAAALVGLGKALGKTAGTVPQSVLLATASGVMYGLQDVATRAAIVVVQERNFAALITTVWPYLVLAAATAGVLLSQSAFRTARLDHALPPTAAAQPICGVALGVGLLGDRLSSSPVALAVEILCLIGMLAGVAAIGRSPALSAARDKGKERTRVIISRQVRESSRKRTSGAR